MPTLEHQRKPTNPCNRNAILNELFNASCLSQVEACCLTNDHWQLAFGGSHVRFSTYPTIDLLRHANIRRRTACAQGKHAEILQIRFLSLSLY